MLPPEMLQEILNFMEYLYQEEEGFDYTGVENSAQYVRKLREEQSSLKKVNKKTVGNFSRSLSSGKNRALKGVKVLFYPFACLTVTS